MQLSESEEKREDFRARLAIANINNDLSQADVYELIGTITDEYVRGYLTCTMDWYVSNNRLVKDGINRVKFLSETIPWK